MDLHVASARHIAQTNVHYPGGVPGEFNPEAAPAAPASTKPGQQAMNALKTMYQSFERFRNTFNPEVQLIEAGRQQVKEAYRALTQVDWGSSPIDEQQIIQQSQAVQQLLDQATQEESQDIAFLQQLSSQMGQLGQMVGSRGATGVQMPQVAPQSAQPAAPQAPQENFWQRMKNWVGTPRQPAIASSGMVLTAGMSSAKYK